MKYQLRLIDSCLWIYFCKVLQSYALILGILPCYLFVLFMRSSCINHVCFWNVVKFVATSLLLEDFIFSKVTDSTFPKHTVILKHTKILSRYKNFELWSLIKNIFVFEFILIWLWSALFVLWISGFPYFPDTKPTFLNLAEMYLLLNLSKHLSLWEFILKVIEFMHILNTARGSTQQTWFLIQQTVATENIC